jgi:hypothetical protein
MSSRFPISSEWESPILSYLGRTLRSNARFGRAVLLPSPTATPQTTEAQGGFPCSRHLFEALANWGKPVAAGGVTENCGVHSGRRLGVQRLAYLSNLKSLANWGRRWTLGSAEEAVIKSHDLSNRRPRESGGPRACPWLEQGASH